MGINLWFAPQISEHCPKYNPGRFSEKLIWFNRPGTPSTLTPNEGIVHEWITSEDEINIWVLVFIGKITRLSTSSKRKFELLLLFVELIIYESNSIA